LIDLGEKNRKKVGKKVNYIIEKFYVYKAKFKEYEKELEECRKALQSTKIREGQKKEEEKELAEKINSFLTDNLAGKHYLELTQKQQDRVKEVKSIPQFDLITGDIIKVHNEIKKGAENTIYSTKT